MCKREFSIELHKKIIQSKEYVESKMGFKIGLISYKDLFGFSDTNVYRSTGSQLDPYFVQEDHFIKIKMSSA